MIRSSRAGLVLSSVAVLLVAAPAAAQEALPAAPAPGAPSAPCAEAMLPSMSLAIERVGGVGYARAASTEANTDASLSLTALGIGGVTLNPFAVPRVGVDFILPSNVTLGGAVGFTRLSGSTSSGSKSQDVGSVFLYSLTPRVGYRIPLSDKIDLTPRGGLTFAGASGSLGDSKNDASIFAVAISADAPLAFRLTDSFNLLAGAAIDYTVSATATTTTSSTTVTGGPTGTTTSTSTKSDDLKGSLFSMQAWLGMGGYL